MLKVTDVICFISKHKPCGSLNVFQYNANFNQSLHCVPVNKYMLKIDDINIRKMSELFSKLTLKTTE